MTDLLVAASLIGTMATALATIALTFLVQRPYVRLIKVLTPDRLRTARYTLKNTGPGTAVSVILQDGDGNVIALGTTREALVQAIDKLPPGATVWITVPEDIEPVCAYYESPVGLLFRTQLAEWMTGRKIWPVVDDLPAAVRRALPRHWWRRR
jgi:hypothetical protein